VEKLRIHAQDEYESTQIQKNYERAFEAWPGELKGQKKSESKKI